METKKHIHGQIATRITASGDDKDQAEREKEEEWPIPKRLDLEKLHGEQGLEYMVEVKKQV